MKPKTPLTSTAKKSKNRKTTIAIRKEPIIQIQKSFLKLCDQKIAYFILGSRAFKYPAGKSRILYVGESTRAIKRPFDSLKERVQNLLTLYGIKHLTLVYVQAPPRQKVKMSKLLQDGILFEFRALYGSLPKENSHGGARQKYWPVERLRQIIEQFEN